jgi:sporulation protein YlmC with PRC-barrel domain
VVYRLKQLVGLDIEASDGAVGKIKDLYFDDHSWVVRYVVVEAGGWFTDRKVLISPISVSRIDWDNNAVELSLTRQQVKTSPLIDTDKPVSRQHEADFFDYYGYPYYWNGPSLWGDTANPTGSIGTAPPVRNTPGLLGESPLDPRLRSAHEVIGYSLQATDSSMGHLEDFLLDAETWGIRYLVVSTHDWLPGKHVVIPPQWIRDVDWTQRVVNVDVSSDQVKASPEFDLGSKFSRAHETNLYWHYQRHEVPMPAPGECGMPKCAPIDPEKRAAMIRRAAYFRSQQRGPCLSHEAEDWLAAEKQIDRMLTGHA